MQRNDGHSIGEDQTKPPVIPSAGRAMRTAKIKAPTPAQTNSSGHSMSENQTPIAARKLSTKRGRQSRSESHLCRATAGGEEAKQRPIANLEAPPAATPFDGHPSTESQGACAVEPQANADAHSNWSLPAAPSARKRNKTAGQRSGESQFRSASNSDHVGQSRTVDHSRNADLIASIRENYKLRVDYHRTEKALTLRIKAQCRRACGGDRVEAADVYSALMDIYTPPKRRALKEHPLAHIVFGGAHKLLTARSVIEETRMEYEKKIEELAARLPIAKFCETARGFGVLSLAQIVGEAGDIGTYATKERLWKRMGMAVIGGERQQKKAGIAALEHGYAPQRRSLMWVIGDILIKSASPRYKNIYNQRKEYERAKAEAAGLKVLPAGDAFSRKNPDKVRTVGHIHNRAKRVMEKALLEDIWKAWRAMAIHGTSAKPDLPSSPRPDTVFAEAAE